MSSKEQREKELFEREGEIAERIIDWFDLLIDLRRAADAGPPPETVVDRLRRADPAMLHHDYMWLIRIFSERFILGRQKLDRGRPAQITAERYLTAWEESRAGSVSDVAKRMKVSRQALQTWLKANPEKRLPKKK